MTSLLQFAILFHFAAAAATAQERPGSSPVLDVSSFMMPPRQTWAPIDRSADANVVVTENAGDGDLGFRVLHLRGSVKGKKQAAIDLARSELVQTGTSYLASGPFGIRPWHMPTCSLAYLILQSPSSFLSETNGL